MATSWRFGQTLKTHVHRNLLTHEGNVALRVELHPPVTYYILYTAGADTVLEQVFARTPDVEGRWPYLAWLRRSVNAIIGGKEKITGEFPEVRSDKRKPREDRQNHRY